MPTIPTTSELFAAALANFEANTGQTAPTLPKAVKRVMSKILAATGTILYKYLNSEMKQIFAQTAGLAGLKIIGAEQNPQIIYKYATRAILTLTLTSSQAGETISTSNAFVADDSGLRYFATSATTTTTPTTSVEVRCESTGTDGNLNPTDTLTLEQSVTGVDSTAEVSTLDTAALDDEDLEVFRSRVLTAMRATPGYGNAYDYKNWAESVAGVEYAFPYSGKPGGDEDVTGFLDGDMENVGVGDWTAENSATLTKNAVTFHGGAQSLQVTRNAVADPMASQACLTANQYYNINGWVRSDGSAIPVICDSATKTTVYWRGTISTSWQYFNIDFKAITDEIMLCAETNTGVEYVLWDDIDLNVSYPGDRTVYVQSNTTIDPDGIAPQTLLDSVRAVLLVGPVTGLSRMGLVDTDDRLYVESIYRTEIHVRVNALAVSSALESATKTAVTTAVQEYLLAVKPFIIGVDSELDRNDTITHTTLSAVIQKVLSSKGATATSIDFDLDGTFTAPYDSYQAGYGERFKLSTPIIWT